MEWATEFGGVRRPILVVSVAGRRIAFRRFVQSHICPQKRIKLLGHNFGSLFSKYNFVIFFLVILLSFVYSFSIMAI